MGKHRAEDRDRLFDTPDRPFKDGVVKDLQKVGDAYIEKVKSDPDKIQNSHY